MEGVKTDWHGSLSNTPRANAVRSHFESEGVPGRKIGVVDNCRPQNRRYSFETSVRRVSVWEKPADTEDDLDHGEFSDYITACNRIINSDPDSRFTDEDETRCAISHDYVDGDIMSKQANPAQAGQELADPTEDSLSENELISVFHHGGNRFTVIRETPSDDDSDASRRVYRVDMDKPLGTGEPVEPVLEGQPEPGEDEAFDVIAAVVTQAPSYREGPQEQLNVTVESPAAGNASGTASSGDTTESDTSQSGEDVDVVSAPGSDHDYDPDELVEAVDSWLENWSTVKTDIQPGIWDLSFQRITNPSNGQSDLGVLIELEPWETDYWDSSSNSWNSDDGSVPEEWKDHQAAMRSIFSNDGPVTGFSVDNPDSDYDDWYNYVPASDAGTL